jgi:sugar phosphate isomerase/epimerase
MRSYFMKIGISVYGRGLYGNDNYKKMREHGFEAVDYFLLANTDSEPYQVSENELKALMEKEKNLAAEAGIEIFQTHGPWRWPPQDATDEDRAERLDKMKTCVRATSYLGCKYTVIHPIMPYHTDDKLKGKEKETFELNVTFMRELVTYAKDYGVTVCLENMPMRNLSISTVSEILDFVKYINEDNFKVCLDTGHSAVTSGADVGKYVRLLGDYLKVLHVHDNNGEKDEHKPMGEGIIDWQDFAKSLQDIGYDGVFCIEIALPSKEGTDQRAIALANSARDIMGV